MMMVIILKNLKERVGEVRDISPRGKRFLGTWSKKIRMLVFGQGGSLVTQRYGIRLPMQKM